MILFSESAIEVRNSPKFIPLDLFRKIESLGCQDGLDLEMVGLLKATLGQTNIPEF
jgi:hypothetical protein